MIENTSNRDPLIHMLGSMADARNAQARGGGAQDGLSKYVADMESAGQAQLVDSQMVPFEGHEELKALGFTFGERPDRDDLFIPCSMPFGWKKEGSDHAMWSYLLDERGIRRVAMFYKAAFYDRRAFLRLEAVGRSLASDIIYGDGPVALPRAWRKLIGPGRAGREGVPRPHRRAQGAAMTWRVNTDVRCPNCLEYVNVRCWQCKWERDPQERAESIRLGRCGCWMTPADSCKYCGRQSMPGANPADLAALAVEAVRQGYADRAVEALGWHSDLLSASPKRAGGCR